MDITNALKYLENGQAAKRTSWGGYIEKTITSADDAEVETYTLTLVTRDGTKYVYTYDGTNWVAPETPMSMDVDFFASLLEDDWDTGKASAFEEARSGTGIW